MNYEEIKKALKEATPKVEKYGGNYATKLWKKAKGWPPSSITSSAKEPKKLTEDLSCTLEGLHQKSETEISKFRSFARNFLSGAANLLSWLSGKNLNSDFLDVNKAITDFGTFIENPINKKGKIILKPKFEKIINLFETMVVDYAKHDFYSKIYYCAKQKALYDASKDHYRMEDIYYTEYLNLDEDFPDSKTFIATLLYSIDDTKSDSYISRIKEWYNEKVKLNK